MLSKIMDRNFRRVGMLFPGPAGRGREAGWSKGGGEGADVAPVPRRAH